MSDQPGMTKLGIWPAQTVNQQNVRPVATQLQAIESGIAEVKAELFIGDGLLSHRKQVLARLERVEQGLNAIITQNNEDRAGLDKLMQSHAGLEQAFHHIEQEHIDRAMKGIETFQNMIAGLAERLGAIEQSQKESDSLIRKGLNAIAERLESLENGHNIVARNVVELTQRIEYCINRGDSSHSILNARLLRLEGLASSKPAKKWSKR